MRLIPVIDLLGGQAVHAVKGEREHYMPLQSVLCGTSSPLAVARAFRDTLELNEIYLADLEAIQSSGRVDHREVIATLARREGINVILDAGISDVESACAWLDLGVRKVVIAAETLRSWDSLQDIPSKVDRKRLVFSLDFCARKILSQCPVLAAMPFMEVLEHLQSAGWQEVILLDLARVGTGEGTDRALVAAVRAGFPAFELLVGGGIANLRELAELESLDVAGVLAATALHRGIISAQDISALRARKGF